MKDVKRFIYYWVPAILWMGLIFYLSSRPSVKVADEYTLNFLFFKTAHVVFYAILYFLLFRGFYSLQSKQDPPIKTYIWPMILSILYGASDELHQTFIPTRTGTVRDVFIDTLGIVLMFQYTKYNLQRLKLFL